MEQKLICKAFSYDDFEKTFPFFYDGIEWKIIGSDSSLKEKKAVIRKCAQTKTYFEPVKTRFIIQNIINELHFTFVPGTAEFIKSGKTQNKISAFDIYKFYKDRQLCIKINNCSKSGKLAT